MTTALAEVAVCARAIRACCSVTGATTILATSTSWSNWRLATGSRLPSMTAAASSQFAAEICRSVASSIARAMTGASVSSRRIAISADVSTITAAARARSVQAQRRRWWRTSRVGDRRPGVTFEHRETACPSGTSSAHPEAAPAR